MLEILTSQILTDADIQHGFTVGMDFSSPEAFRALQAQLDTSKPIFKVKQVHGRAYSVTSNMTASAWDEAAAVEGDALIADTEGVVGVVTADCVPILLACTHSGLRAAIHAGWRGLKKGVVRDTVKGMLHRGASVGSMICAIGPCICYHCYEVSEEVANLFPESSDAIKGSEGQYLLDIAQAVEVSLIGVGMSTSQMDVLNICTSCGERDLFSYRKSGGTCGRQYAFICK